MWTCERGDALELTIERGALGGDGVGRAPDGRVVFVRGGLPGDLLKVELVQVKRRFLRGVVQAVLRPGSTRREAPCPRVAECGGCPWMPLPPEAQRAVLDDQLKRMLDRALGAPAPLSATVPAEPSLGWRSTVRLHWADGRLGFRPPRGRGVLDLERCPVMAPSVARLFAAARDALRPALTGQGTLRITADDDGGTLAVEPDGPAPGLARALARFVEAEPACRGARLRGRSPRDFGQPVNHLGPHGVAHPADAFVQAHQPGAQQLARTVVDFVGPPSGPVLELYAGSGHFTLALAAVGHEVVAIERQRVAAEALQAAAAARGLGGRVTARAGDAAALPRGAFKVAVIDPPRAGARDALPGLDRAGIERLVYVSCEPSTFARDAAWLRERGWRAARIVPFDLFPHTGHVELVACFERAGPAEVG